MHQPEYRDLVHGTYQLPWAYLHAIKDYVDMAALLEENPGARCVVNFAPVLLDQLADYAQQTRAHLNDSGLLRDPLLAAIDQPVLPVRPEHRLELIRACLRANKGRLIHRFPVYHRLAEMAQWTEQHPDTVMYLGEQYLIDLLVWYHLAWLGETVKRQDARVERLIEKGSGFTLHDRRELLEVIDKLLNGLIGRYRALADRGQIELAMSPYAHPIVPLLLDMQCAREAMPHAPMPALTQYPGGDARARWHIEKGLQTFERYFGRRPQGCWPSEGSVSAPTLALLNEYGFRWAASGEGVLRQSVHHAGLDTHQRDAWMHKPYKVTGAGDTACFFRDDGLSDLIGFTYADWHGDDAANNLVHHLENIARAVPGRNAVVSIILDGENAWEHYPNNGYFFLSSLYQRLSDHPLLELTTYSDYLDDHASRSSVGRLPALISGSWVYGTLSTWIGDKDKNRGWDILGEAKRVYDASLFTGYLPRAQLENLEWQLAACEGSDWFWWFGDYNPADTVSDFERLFRLHITNLYHMLGEEAPTTLSRAVSHGGGAPARGGAMRPGQE